MAIDVSGTHRNIPGTPQTMFHNAKENKITNGLRFSLSPWNLGSITLPMPPSSTPTPISTTKNGPKFSNCISAKNVGMMVAIIEPTVGIKLSTKTRNAQKLAKLRPTLAITK